MRAGRSDRSFPKACRLTSGAEFRRVFRSGRRGRVGPFAWHAHLNACHHPRLGMAVPKRVVKRATDRSRVKRLIRESFRRNQSRLPALDVVVSVKAVPHDPCDPALHRLIDNIWEQVLSSGGGARRKPETK